MNRICLQPGCGAITPNARCQRHARRKEQCRQGRSIYSRSSGWRAHSEQRRREQPWCSICGTHDDLTVDHVTDEVWCRSHHDSIEAARRAAARA